MFCRSAGTPSISVVASTWWSGPGGGPSEISTLSTPRGRRGRQASTAATSITTVSCWGTPQSALFVPHSSGTAIAAWPAPTSLVPGGVTTGRGDAASGRGSAGSLSEETSAVPPITVNTAAALAKVTTTRRRWIVTPAPASGIGLPSTAIWSPASLGDSDVSDLEEFSNLDEPRGFAVPSVSATSPGRPGKRPQSGGCEKRASVAPKD